MNYLETGLPHTQFYRKKTEFSPPRFIPLCGLSRKYQGLEPLTRKEVDILIRRLSEPKKSQEGDDQTSVSQIRPRSSPGSGRFVGQKKMSSLEIEQMVSRLCNKRPTKDYPYESDTVEAEDIMRMTNRIDDSSDSEEEANIITTEPEVSNSRRLFRRHSSAVTLRRDSENIDDTKRDSENHVQRKVHSAIAQNNECFENSSNKSWESQSKTKTSPKNINTQFDFHSVGLKHENIMSVKSWAARVSSERIGNKEHNDVAKFRPDLKYRPLVRFSRGSYFCPPKSRFKTDKISEENVPLSPEVQHTTVTAISIKRPMSYPGNAPTYRSESVNLDEERKFDLEAIFASMSRPGRGAELTRPPPSVVQLSPSPARNEQTELALNNDSTKSNKKPNDLLLDPEQTHLGTQSDPLASPRAKFPKIEVSGRKMFKNPNDDLLIEHVASCNRNFKFRSK
ncbi:hypothetical protein ACF0H5_019642 [Mactra antiquata]